MIWQHECPRFRKKFLSIGFLFTHAFLVILFAMACKQQKTPPKNPIHSAEKQRYIKYAKGFQIIKHPNYKEIIVTAPWPKSKKQYRYVLYNKNRPAPDFGIADVVIKTPVTSVVVTSTTNIPMLEYLGVEKHLVGFPTTAYINSKKTRARIDQGKVKDLNSDLNMNMEVLLDLKPALVIGFSVNGNNKILKQIESYDIPVVLDGSWVESQPLGRAEWLKFVAAFFDKEKIADSIFNHIENDYLIAKSRAEKAPQKPTVFSGSMYRDVWNVPGGQSFMAKYLKDAHTAYIWSDNLENGSLQLSFETVLSKAQKASLWIGAGKFQTQAEMASSSQVYTLFEAYKKKQIYTYVNPKTANDGLLFYELGPLRPDIILNDIIHIAHPKLLPNYTPFFFKHLD